MKRTLFALLIAVCAAPALAQSGTAAGPKDQSAAQAQQSGATSAETPQRKTSKARSKQAPAQADAKVQAAAQPAQPAPAAPARKAVRQEQAKPAEEPEESVVMIDSKGDPEETGRFSAGGYAPDQDEAPAVPGGMPSSYGQLKGVMNDGGRTLLVLESPDDGTITFVHVTAGKNGVAWKLLDRIPRSLE